MPPKTRLILTYTTACWHAGTNPTATRGYRQHELNRDVEPHSCDCATADGALMHNIPAIAASAQAASSSAWGLDCEKVQQILLAEVGLTQVIQMLKVAPGAELEHDKQSPPERYDCGLLGLQLCERSLRHLVQTKDTQQGQTGTNW